MVINIPNSELIVSGITSRIYKHFSAEQKIDCSAEKVEEYLNTISDLISELQSKIDVNLKVSSYYGSFHQSHPHVIEIQNSFFVVLYYPDLSGFKEYVLVSANTDLKQCFEDFIVSIKSRLPLQNYTGRRS